MSNKLIFLSYFIAFFCCYYYNSICYYKNTTIVHTIVIIIELNHSIINLVIIDQVLWSKIVNYNDQ